MPEATQVQLRAEQLIDAMWNDASVGGALQKKAKELFPDAKIRTNDEIYEPVMGPIRAEATAIKKEIADLRAERETEKAARDEARQKRALTDALNEARTEFSLTDEGFDQMVARMKATNNFTDAAAAAAWVVSKNPPKNPKGPTWAPQDLNLFGAKKHDEAMAELHRDPLGYMDAQLNEFVSDPDKYVRDTFGVAA